MFTSGQCAGLLIKPGFKRRASPPHALPSQFFVATLLAQLQDLNPDKLSSVVSGLDPERAKPSTLRGSDAPKDTGPDLRSAALDEYRGAGVLEQYTKMMNQVRDGESVDMCGVWGRPQEGAGVHEAVHKGMSQLQ